MKSATTTTTTIASETDKLVNALFEKLQEKKKLIEKLEKPQWKTNFSFGFDPQQSGRINLQTCDVSSLITINGFLTEQKKLWDASCEELGLTNKPFQWQGFDIEDWKSDIKTRIAKISIDTRKKELKELETKLNSLVSPEQRRLMELDLVMKALAD